EAVVALVEEGVFGDEGHVGRVAARARDEGREDEAHFWALGRRRWSRILPRLARGADLRYGRSRMSTPRVLIASMTLSLACAVGESSTRNGASASPPPSPASDTE